MSTERQNVPQTQSDTPASPPPSRHRGWSTTTKVVVAVMLTILAGLALYLFRIALIPLVIGSLMAYLLTPVVKWISADPRIPRGLATALIYLALLLIVLPLPASLVPWVVGQVTFLQSEMVRFAGYLEEISADTVEILGFNLVVEDLVNEVAAAITGLVTSAAPASLTLVFSAAEVLLLVIFTFLVAFYLTKDGAKFKAWFAGLVPPDYQEDVRLLIREIDAIWSAFLRGQLILMFVVSVLLTVASAILGLPQPLLLGILGGLLEFLPSVGHAIWLITASILALIEGSLTLPVSEFVFFLIVVGFHIAYTQFDLNFLIPRIIGRRVHLHPLVVIIGIIVGATAGSIVAGPVGSVLGVALAAPTISSLRVLGRYIYARLFDLDPFPMVGPPSAPSAEREQAVALLETGPPPVREAMPGRAAINRLRREFSNRSRRGARKTDTQSGKQS